MERKSSWIFIDLEASTYITVTVISSAFNVTLIFVGKFLE